MNSGITAELQEVVAKVQIQPATQQTKLMPMTLYEHLHANGTQENSYPILGVSDKCLKLGGINLGLTVYLP